MLHSTIVPVNRKPVFHRLAACKGFVIVRIDIAKEIPGRSCPLWHRIRLTLCLATAARTSCLYPVADICDWRLTIVGRHIIVNFRKFQWKFFFRNRNITAFFTFYNRNRLTPVTLSGKYPVTQFEVCLFRTDTFFFQPFNDGFLCFFYRFSCEESGIYKSSRSNICEGCFFYISSFDYLDNRNIKFLCELPVTVVMRRNRHDSTGSVTHQYIIRYPYRNFFSIYRIYCGQALNLDTCLFFRKLGSFKIGFSCCHLTISNDFIPVCNLIFVFVKIWMFRRNNHIRYTKQCIRTCCIDAEFLFLIFELEIHLCTMRTSDPVFLGNFNTLNIIHVVQIINQFICIFGNF